MSEGQNSNSLSSRKEARRSTPDILICERDERFFQSILEFIEHEKRCLRCPEDGPDELRYIIYRSVFNKVIVQATDYKRLLLTIKTEYDDIIRELKRREDEDRAAQQTVVALMSHLKSLRTCQSRANQLRDRISELQKETSKLQKEMKTQRSSKEQSTWIPGLTVAQSEDPEALVTHLQHLETQRAALLDRRRHCVSLAVKAELDVKLQIAESHRDQLSTENGRLTVLFKHLMFMCDCLSSWERGGGQVPLEELVDSSLENIRQTSVTEDDGLSIDAQLFEEEEPTGVDQSELLTDDLDRFIELFDSAQYEEAALLAARSPGGVLRSLHTMTMFKAVHATPGSVPPPLLFIRSLLIAVPPGVELSAPLSVQCVISALQHGALQLITHAVTQNKLTFTEHLGDIFIEHVPNEPSEADLCLALATIVYEACGLDRKTALSMCRRGLIHSAAEFMKHCKDFTAEDCIWVLCCLPSLSLLQVLTRPQGRGQAAFLSVGQACSTLLADHQQWELALQLLEDFVSRGPGALQDVILEDSGSSVDIWIYIASLCSELKRADLSRAILSILLDQGGTRVLSPDLEGAQLMEHVFL